MKFSINSERNRVDQPRFPHPTKSDISQSEAHKKLLRDWEWTENRGRPWDLPHNPEDLLTKIEKPQPSGPSTSDLRPVLKDHNPNSTPQSKAPRWWYFHSSKEVPVPEVVLQSWPRLAGTGVWRKIVPPSDWGTRWKKLLNRPLPHMREEPVLSPQPTESKKWDLRRRPFGDPVLRESSAAIPVAEDGLFTKQFEQRTRSPVSRFSRASRCPAPPMHLSHDDAIQDSSEWSTSTPKQSTLPINCGSSCLFPPKDLLSESAFVVEVSFQPSHHREGELLHSQGLAASFADHRQTTPRHLLSLDGEMCAFLICR